MALHTLADVALTTGTNVQLTTSSIRANWIKLGGFKATGTNNAANVRYGDSSISDTQGGIILPGTTELIPYNGSVDGYSLSDINVRGSTGDKVTVQYYTR